MRIASVREKCSEVIIFKIGKYNLSHVIKTKLLGAAIIIASSFGANIFPAINGQLIEDYPMTLMYLTASTIILCSMIFMSTVFIGGKIRLERRQVVQV